MNNDSNKDLIEEEIVDFGDEAEQLDDDETYHSSGLSDIELSQKTDERSYYIEFKDADGRVLTTIYVDRHDYLLYKRPIWREWKMNQLERRCLIPAKDGNGYKRCMEDCSNCSFSKSGLLSSLDLMKENTNFEPADKDPDPNELALINEANRMLWDIVRKLSTDGQFEKIKLYFVDGLTFKRIGEIYGVSHKAIEKAIKAVLTKAKNHISEEDYFFLAKYILK